MSSSVASINKEEAEKIYNEAIKLYENIANDLQSLDREIMDLPIRGEWKGDSADNFMDCYLEMQDNIKTKFPELLMKLAENLNTNLKNFISADNAGAGA